MSRFCPVEVWYNLTMNINNEDAGKLTMTENEALKVHHGDILQTRLRAAQRRFVEKVDLLRKMEIA